MIKSFLYGFTISIFIFQLLNKDHIQKSQVQINEDHNHHVKLFYKKQIECLAKNIYFEARSSTDLDKKAVAYVTINRTLNDKWPQTVCQVVYQVRKKSNGKKVAQFSWVTEKKDHTPYEKQIWRKIENLAKNVYVHSFDSLYENNDITNGSDHYYQPSLIKKPYWAEKEYVIAQQQIGDHIYLKLK